MAEAKFYYSGLCSSPALVYRTGTTPWIKPTGLEAYRQLKELHPVFNHKINIVWEEVGPKVCQLLDDEKIRWTSIDIVRFKVEEGPVGPVILWIGVVPETLSSKDARTSANDCLSLLQQFGITDIEVEFRGSIYTRSVGPGLLKPVTNLHPTVSVRGALTPVLGLSIAAEATPYAQGTGGLYLAEGGGSQRVLLLTARHVLFPVDERSNIDYVYKNSGERRRNVILLGTSAFDDLIESTKGNIGLETFAVELYEEAIKILENRLVSDDEDEVRAATKGLRRNQALMNDAKDNIEGLKGFHDQVKTGWSQTKDRIVGHIIHSPCITLNTGTRGFTEDYAIVELHSAKFKGAFEGNVLDLGTKIPGPIFKTKMQPYASAATSFKYPASRLLQLQGAISENLMCNPDMLDHNSEPCLLVIKNGITSGVTIGRATGCFSYVREHLSNDTYRTSKEWAILPYDKWSGPFSRRGDSGSIIVDGRGRIGGLLTGGAGKTEALDITYATPFFWLLTRIKANGFPNAHLNPQF